MRPALSSGFEAASELVLQISEETPIPWVQAAVRRFARRAEAGRTVEWALAIAASEAATNIQKFAGRGAMALSVEPGPPRTIVLVAEDEGAGLPSAEAAFRDGVSEGVDLATLEVRVGRRGRGTGLGAIRRLMDSVTVERSPRGGTRLLARKAIG